MTSKFTLGLDVSKLSIDVCLLPADGRPQKTVIDNSIAGFQKLLCWLDGVDLSQLHVCLEPTGKYSRAVAGFLHEAGLRISQVNSYTVLCHGRSKNYRSKTDSIDAFLLADYCLKENPSTWSPAPQSHTELNELQMRIYDLAETIRQENNRLEAGGISTLVRQNIEEHLAYLTVQKKRLELASRNLVKSDPLLGSNFSILHSIIGLGEQSAISLLAAVRFERFEKPRSVGCFAGLTPRLYRSGTSIYKRECISRVGSNELRRVLYFPAMSAMQHNPQMRAFAERLRAKGKPSKVIICAIMRKLLVLAATLIRKQVFYDSTKGMLPV